MTTETQGTGTALEELLDAVVREAVAGRADATRRRYERVLAHLHLFLDRVDVRGPLGLDVALALEAERDRGRELSFVRRLGPPELVACLPDFLAPGWLALRRSERRAQTALVERVLRRVALEPGGADVVRGPAGTAVREALRVARSDSLGCA